MLDVTASYGMYLFANFAHNWRIFMSQVLYIHQTFTDFLSNQYIYFDMLICQMQLQVQVTEGSRVWLGSLEISMFDTFNYENNFNVSSCRIFNCIFESVYNIKMNLCKHLWLRKSSFFLGGTSCPSYWYHKAHFLIQLLL